MNSPYGSQVTIYEDIAIQCLKFRYAVFANTILFFKTANIRLIHVARVPKLATLTNWDSVFHIQLCSHFLNIGNKKLSSNYLKIQYALRIIAVTSSYGMTHHGVLATKLFIK